MMDSSHLLVLVTIACAGAQITQIVQHPANATFCEGTNATLNCTIFDNSTTGIADNTIWFNVTSGSPIQLVDNVRDGDIVTSILPIMDISVYINNTEYLCQPRLGTTSSVAVITVVVQPMTTPVLAGASDLQRKSCIIKWTTANPNNIHSYIITWTNLHNGDMDNIEVQGHTTSYNVTGLNGVDNYNVSVTAKNPCGMMKSDFITVYDKPDVPVNVRIPPKDIKSDSLVVHWDAVADVFPITYTVRWYGEDIDNTTTTNGLSYTVTGLTSNTSYSVTVVANNTCCGAGPVSDVMMATTITSQDSITNRNGGRNDDMSIGLIVGIIAAVVVFAIIVIIVVVILHWKFRRALSTPTNVKATVLTPNSVKVTWDRSPRATGYLISYTTTASCAGDKNARVNDGDTTSHILTNLVENAPYMITVQSLTGTGRYSDTSTSVSVIIRKAALCSPPEDIEVTSVDPASLRVSWQLPLEINCNGPITGYIIKYARVGLDDIRIINVPNQAIHIISELFPCTEYSITVAAVNANGTGPFSKSVGATSGEDEVEEILRRGEVPPLPWSTHVCRPDATKEVQQLLRTLKTTDGWVVLHGMMGCGKSVLAAEALRDGSLLKEVFPGGVFWVNMSEGTTSYFDSAELLRKMQLLLLRLNNPQYHPTNPQYHPTNPMEAQIYLQKVISEQYPKCLLVLDNLLSADIAKHFSVRCRVLVTTRNKEVAYLVQTPHHESLDVSSMFRNDQLLKVLAKWVNKSPEELPPYADITVNLSRGLPMIISLIGALLRNNSSETHWKAYNEKLQSNPLSIQLHNPPAQWQYHSKKLVPSIELSINEMDEDLKKFFRYLVVLDYHISVSSEALAILWGTNDVLEAENIMLQFVGYSLTQKTKKPSGNKGYWSFVVHDLITSYLRSTISEEDTRCYHKGLVNNYREQCNRDFTSVSADGYVHQQLLYHLEQAGEHETRASLLNNLCWLRACIRHCSPSVVLAWYTKECIGKKCATIANYQHFLSQNMDKLVLDHDVDDIIQLALLLPETSPIYQQAVEIVEREKLFWLHWNNKTSTEQALLLSSQVHEDNAFHAQFSHDSLNVVSCSSENDLKVWQHTTGCVIQNLTGHTNSVTHCVMSSSGNYIVSCSEDCTVKVWDAHHGKRLGECEIHEVGVQCCDVSHDEHMIVSCDISSTVKLWLLDSRKLHNSWNHHQSSSSSLSGTTHCRFLDHSNYNVVTCSTDGSIKIWNDEGRLIIPPLNGHNGPVNCVTTRGHLMCTGGNDCNVMLWDTKKFESLGVLRCKSYVHSCNFDRDGDVVITGEFDGHVKLWRVKDLSLLSLVTTHATQITCVGYSPDNQLILSSNNNGVVKIHHNEWQEEGVTTLREEPMKFNRRFTAHFDETKNYMPTIACIDSKDNSLKLLRGEAASVMRTQATHCTPRSYKFTPDGSKLVIGFTNGDLQLIDTESGEELWMKQKAHSSEILRCHFSLNGSRVVTVSLECHKVFSTADGRLISRNTGYGHEGRLCRFLLDNVSLLSVQKDCSVKLWNTDNGGDIRTFQFSNHDCSNAEIFYISLSPEDDWLAASTSAGVTIVWRISDATEVTMTPQYQSCARVCAVDKHTLCVGYDDGTLRIWDIPCSKKNLRQCHTYTQYWMIDCAFSPDHSQIVTLSDSIKWWSIDGTLRRTFFLKGYFGKHVLFSRDFKIFITIDKIGNLYVLTSHF